MSRVDELIADLAPKGVEIKALGDVGQFVRGNGLQKSDLTDDGVPAIHYGQVHTHYGVWAETTKSFTDPEYAGKLRRAKYGDLVIATTSEDDAAVAKATAWLGQSEAAVSGDAYIYRHGLDSKYVAYFFGSTMFQDQKTRHITGTKVRRISGDALAKIRIPVPPIEVQREIVRVMDAWVDLEAQLRAKLNDELSARRAQYAAYRARLLSDARSSADVTTLGAVATVKTGQAPPASILLDDGEYFFVNAGTTPSGRTTEANTPGDTVTIPSRGQGGLGIAGYQPSDFWCGPLCYRIRSVTDDLLNPYLYHYLKSIQEELRSLQQTGGTPALNRKELIQVPVAIPPVDQQRRVVDALDRMHALTTELTKLLTDELTARRAQFAYYRDKLLTFEEAVA